MKIQGLFTICFFWTIGCLSQITVYSSNDSVSIGDCPKISFNLWFASPYKIVSYYDYDEGLRCSKKSNKPYLVYFTGHGSLNSRKMEAYIWSDKEVLILLKNRFVLTTLYVDDKSLILPKEKQVISEYSGDTIELYSKKQIYIEKIKFKEDNIPVYFIIDSKETILAGPFYYNRSKKRFKKFLEHGIEAFMNTNGDR